MDRAQMLNRLCTLRSVLHKYVLVVLPCLFIRANIFHALCTVDVNKMFTKSFTEHVSISDQ